MKNAIVFAADLPAASDLATHLEQRPWRDLFTGERKTGAFWAAKGESLVEPLEGGYALRYRIDEKLVPAAIHKAEAQKKVDEIEEETGRKLVRAERNEIKEAVLYELIETALTKTTTIRAYYDTAENLLYVDTTSDKVAQEVIGELIFACESVKTKTIHVSENTKGLKPRLMNHIAGDGGEQDHNAFGRFDLGANLTLSRKEEGVPVEKVTYKDCSIDTDEVLDLLRQGYQVEQVELGLAGAAFRLTNKFRFKRFEWPEREIEVEDSEDELAHWRAEASLNLQHATLIVTKLCEMMGYVRPSLEEEADGTPAE